MIADLLQEQDLLAALRVELKSIRDIERAAGRLSQASGNARVAWGSSCFTTASSALSGPIHAWPLKPSGCTNT